MTPYQSNASIKSWAEEDRPREKLLLKGRHNLSDAELLAILIGSGTRDETAVDVARRILTKYGDNLAEFARVSYHDLIRLKGIGPVKALTILASMELGRRRNESEVVTRNKITASREAYQILRPELADQLYESFWIILLNRGHKFIRKCLISEGGISSTTVDPKKIFKLAVDHHASAIILGHNHPSGNPSPSEADIQLSKKIIEAGRLLDICVLDHIIFGDDRYYSLRDSGEL